MPRNACAASSSFDTNFCPQACSTCSRLIDPGRSSTGVPRVQSMMVDSMPSSHAPPSRTMRSAPNSPSTWAAVVGLTRPNRFALGAAMPHTAGRPAEVSRNARSMACAAGWAGQRRPMEFCPPALAVPTPARRGKISVKGPGQKADISCWAKGGTAAAKCDTANMPPSCADT